MAIPSPLRSSGRPRARWVVRSKSGTPSTVCPTSWPLEPGTPHCPPSQPAAAAPRPPPPPGTPGPLLTATAAPLPETGSALRLGGVSGLVAHDPLSSHLLTITERRPNGEVGSGPHR